MLSEVAAGDGARPDRGTRLQDCVRHAVRHLRCAAPTLVSCTLDMVAAFTAGTKTMDVNGDPVPVLAGVVSENLFDLLDIRPILGRALTAEDNHVGAVDVAVLGHDLWMTRFGGDPAVIGRAVRFSEKPFTIVGVMPPGFEFETGVKLWLPAAPTLDPSNRPSIHNITVVGRLAAGQTVAMARAELGALPVEKLRAQISSATELTRIEVGKPAARAVRGGHAVAGSDLRDHRRVHDADSLRKSRDPGAAPRITAAAGVCGSRGARCRDPGAHPRAALAVFDRYGGRVRSWIAARTVDARNTAVERRARADPADRNGVSHRLSSRGVRGGTRRRESQWR